MGLTTYPVTPDRFEDFADVVNPRRRATHCWCVLHRLTAREIVELGGREAAARALGLRRHPPGVVGYDEAGTPVAWCSVGPRADNAKLVASRLIRPIDDPVDDPTAGRDDTGTGAGSWSVVCVVVRGGHRRRGHAVEVIEGAVAWAAADGAAAVEAHPVDATEAEGGRIDTTMAFVGTRAMFEAAGFEVVGRTDAVASGLPRLVMRRRL